MPSIYLVAHIPEHVPDDYDPLESQPVHEVAPHPRDTVVVGEWLPLTAKQLDDVLTGRDIHAPVCREVALKGHRFTTRFRMEHPRGPIDAVIYAEDAETAEHAFIGLLITSAWSKSPWCHPDGRLMTLRDLGKLVRWPTWEDFVRAGNQVTLSQRLSELESAGHDDRCVGCPFCQEDVHGSDY